MSYTAIGAGVALGLGGALLKKGVRSRVAARAAFDPTESTGVLLPLGYWDPCGLMKEREGRDGFRWKDEETFERYRTAELKHGRLAMLALTGLLSSAVAKFPMYQADAYKHVDGWAVAGTPAASGIGLFFIMAGYFELTQPKGDFKDPLGVGAYEDWGYTKDLLNKELAHGRLAMSAVLALWLYDYGGVSPSSLLNGGYTGWPLALFAALLLVWSSSDASDKAPESLPESVRVSVSLPEASKEPSKEESVKVENVA